MALVIERLHHLELGQAFTDVTADVRDPVLAQPGQLPDPATEDQNRGDHQRKTQQDDAGQFGVGDEQQDQSADQHQQVAQGNGHGRSDHRLQHRGVGGEAGLDLQRSVVFEEAGMQIDEVVEHPLADVRHHPFADPGHQIEPGERAERQAKHQDKEQADRPRQVVRRLGGQTLIDQDAQALAEAQGQSRGHQKRQQGAQDRPAVGADERQHQRQGFAVTSLNGTPPALVSGRRAGRRDRTRAPPVVVRWPSEPGHRR